MAVFLSWQAGRQAGRQGFDGRKMRAFMPPFSAKRRGGPISPLLLLLLLLFLLPLSDKETFLFFFRLLSMIVAVIGSSSLSLSLSLSLANKKIILFFTSTPQNYRGVIIIHHPSSSYEYTPP